MDLPLWLTLGAIGVWWFALGACIGSFLNVVVYRLPRGMSLIAPGSHCPNCKTPIRWRDNVPVLGWLMLGGRCRSCRQPIAARYPLVEFACGVLFLLMAAAECLTRCGNLPVRLFPSVEITEWPPVSRLQCVGVCLYHLLLLVSLMAASLIQRDGQKVPLRLAVLPGIVAWAVPLAWPHLHPVATTDRLQGLAASLADTSCGVAVGLLAGGLAALACPARGTLLDGRRDYSIVAFAAMLGAFLGWKAALALTLSTALISLVVAVIERGRPKTRGMPPLGWLTMATLSWLLCWRPLVRLFPWLG